MLTVADAQTSLKVKN